MAGFRKAERRKAKLRLGISGPSGSGKTASALLIAFGITGDWNKIGLADTENGSGELYVNSDIGGTRIGEYNILAIHPPYLPDKYIQAIKMAEQEGLEVIILDSLSHAWAGEGGLLDLQGKIAQKTGNSWTAWRDVTPKHNALVEAMLGSKIHVIATMRSKVEHVQEKDEKTNKTIIRKVGMAPIQREGMDYEMTIVFDLSIEHIANCSKDRTNQFDGQYFMPSPETGKCIFDWLESGAEAPPPAQTREQPPTINRPPISGSGNGAPVDIDKARAAFFASINELANRIGIENKYANNYAKEILYKKFNVDSLTKLGQNQWAAIKASQDKIMALMEKAFLKILSDDPAAPQTPPEMEVEAIH